MAALDRFGGEVIQLLIREVISPTDRPTQNPPLGVIPKGGVKIHADPKLDFDAFYPPAALRSGAQASVTATCLILSDLSLFCRKPEVNLPQFDKEPPMWRQPAFDETFRRATLLVLATMRAEPRTTTGEDSVGREASATINWRLP